MKEMFKFVDKVKMVKVFTLAILHSVSVMGISFALSHYATNPLTSDKLIRLLFTLCILYVVSMIFNWLFTHSSQMFLFKIEYDAKNYFYKKLQKINPKNISKYHSGYIQSLIERTGQDYAVIIETILYDFLPLTIGLISFVYMACKQSIIIGIISLTIFLIAFLVRFKMQQNKKKYSKKMNETRAGYNGALIDFIQNIFTVLKLNAEDFTNKILEKKTKLFLRDLQVNEDKTANIRVTFDFFTNLVYIVIIVLAIITTNNGEDALPYLLFYISIIGKVTSKLEKSSQEIEHLFRFQVSKKQLDEIIGNFDEFTLNNNWNTLEIIDGIFSYKQRSREISIPNFKFNKKDKISVTGESGQGKTTILNILSGIYELNSGKILIDSKDFKNEKIDVAFISQDVELFDLSIRENLTLGKNISDERILELFEDAGLMEWYQNLENGLDEMVGEKGVRLSAGQRQRLNIIRGILIDKDVYFFDEPTSNLDKESEEKIVKMIDKYLNDKTYIIVTHRESIKRLCNKHYVFENHKMTLKNI